jgi:hypothetical protein
MMTMPPMRHAPTMTSVRSPVAASLPAVFLVVTCVVVVVDVSGLGTRGRDRRRTAQMPTGGTHPRGRGHGAEDPRLVAWPARGGAGWWGLLGLILTLIDVSRDEETDLAVLDDHCVGLVEGKVELV